ncbi:MAG: DNA primase, partial [Clostridiales bacterium]|nr:DNA primase [Clostridiales bacterium]
MLAYLAAYPEAYQETKDLIDASDFTDPLCSALSKALYAQLEEGGPAEARLVAMFDDPEEQSRAAALFHTSIP